MGLIAAGAALLGFRHSNAIGYSPCYNGRPALALSRDTNSRYFALGASTAVPAALIQLLSAFLMLRLTRFRKTGRCWVSHFGRVRIGIVNGHVVDFIVTAKEKITIT